MNSCMIWEPVKLLKKWHDVAKWLKISNDTCYGMEDRRQ